MNLIDSLIERKVLRIGIEARDNPSSLKGEGFALGIANKDYPAQTPYLWNKVYSHFGIPVKNIRTFGSPDDIDLIIPALRADRRYIGGDIGVGFKELVPKLLDGLDPLAFACGAVNVVVREDAGLKGFNTDGVGFALGLAELLKKTNEFVTGKRVMILGAGGTASSISFVLAKMGASLYILNRTVAKAVNLAGRVNAYAGSRCAQGGGRDEIPNLIKKVDIVISVVDDPYSALDKVSALGEIESPLTTEIIHENLRQTRELLNTASNKLVVCDVMLRTQDTAHIRLAKEFGLRTMDGMPMVINQAVEAFLLVNHAEMFRLGKTKDEVRQLMSSD